MVYDFTLHDHIMHPTALSRLRRVAHVRGEASDPVVA